MPVTLNDLLQSIASYVNQDPTQPTGTDESMWINLLNQSQQEWANELVWRKTLNRQYQVPITDGMVSVGVPATFQSLNSPVYDVSQNPPIQYFEIYPEDRWTKDPTEKYCWRAGDEVTGISLQFNPALASGASIAIDYIATPSSMATYTDVLTCPSSQFVVTRTLAKILGARSDPRYTAVMSESIHLLETLEQNEVAITGGQENNTPNFYSRRHFRVGE